MRKVWRGAEQCSRSIWQRPHNMQLLQTPQTQCRLRPCCCATAASIDMPRRSELHAVRWPRHPLIFNAMRAALLSLAVCIAPECLAQTPSYSDTCRASDTTRALCDVEARLTDALRRNDAALLAQIYDDEFILINYRGTKVDKPAVLSALRSGALRFDSLATSELQLRLYGHVALITGRQRQVAREPGAGDQAHPNDVRYSHLYVLRDGKWFLVASQITPLLARTPPS